MVERTPDNSDASKKPAEEGKKVELLSQTKQIPTEASTSVKNEEEDLEEETKDTEVPQTREKSRAELADQSKHNIPVNPDQADLQELLEVYIKKIKVPSEYAQKLRDALSDSHKKNDQSFSEAMKEVTSEMRKDKRPEVREKVFELNDIEPLFAPHTFWETQPVPQPGDELHLPESCFDQAIKLQTLDEIRKEPYALPEGFNWADVDLKDNK